MAAGDSDQIIGVASLPHLHTRFLEACGEGRKEGERERGQRERGWASERALNRAKILSKKQRILQHILFFLHFVNFFPEKSWSFKFTKYI